MAVNLAVAYLVVPVGSPPSRAVADYLEKNLRCMSGQAFLELLLVSQPGLPVRAVTDKH